MDKSSENLTGGDKTNNNNLLDKYNQHLSNMHLQQRWNSLEEVQISRSFDWKTIIKSKEVLQAILLILLANLRIGLVPFLANSAVLVIVMIYASLLDFYLLSEEYKEKQPQMNDFIKVIGKKVGILAVLFLSLEPYYLQLKIVPSAIYTLTNILFMGLLFQQISVFSEIQLNFKLADKIFISGKEWNINRLVMMNPKAVSLYEFHQNEAQNFKKSQ